MTTPAYAVLPLPFQPSMLVSSTAVEPNPLWVSGTSYALGAKVIWENPGADVAMYYVYESLVAGNTAEPGTDALKWLNIGPSNRTAMFDSRISTRTLAASPLVVVLEPGEITSNIGLLNLTGDHLKIEMLVGGSVVYTAEEDLQGAQIENWWDYYFANDQQITLAVFDALPVYYSQQLRITLTGSGTVGIGHCIFGSRQDLGEMSYGATAQVIDYSRKETDEFGVTTFVQRDYADEFSGQLLVENGQVNSVKRLLRSLRATPTLYVGSDDGRFRELFVAFGWLRSHRIAVTYPNQSLLDLEIGALT